MFATKDLYMSACMKSKDLHVMTDEERLQLQAHLRGMYLEIEKVCDRHHLQMCTGYGTVLGAIRHQGFIPWDDDMDLIMPRVDYDKLINEYCDELPDNFKIYAPNGKEDAVTRFAKVVDTKTRFIFPGANDEECRGIFIDIFPLENTMSNELFVKIKRLFAMVLMVISSSVDQHQTGEVTYKKLMCSSSQGKKTYMLRDFIGRVFSFASKKTWYNLLDNFLQHSKSSDLCVVPSGDGAQWKYFKPYPKSIYFPAKKMNFDDIEVYVPNQAEIHCEIEYGDWSWIPPVEERWQHFIKEIRF
jgi:lipopolysaccharide cholinephosphotransferase